MGDNPRVMNHITASARLWWWADLHVAKPALLTTRVRDFPGCRHGLAGAARRGHVCADLFPPSLCSVVLSCFVFGCWADGCPVCCVVCCLASSSRLGLSLGYVYRCLHGCTLTHCACTPAGNEQTLMCKATQFSTLLTRTGGHFGEKVFVDTV